MPQDPDARFKTALQVVGILGLVGLLSMVFHKAFVDISLLWQQHAVAAAAAAAAVWVMMSYTAA